jgi:hypothetical protein
MKTEPILRLSQRDFDRERLAILRELTGFERAEGAARPADAHETPRRPDALSFIAAAANLAH